MLLTIIATGECALVDLAPLKYIINRSGPVASIHGLFITKQLSKTPREEIVGVWARMYCYIEEGSYSPH